MEMIAVDFMIVSLGIFLLVLSYCMFKECKNK